MIRRPMPRPRILILFAILTVLFAGAATSAYWFWSAEQLRQRIALWTEQQRERGYDISYGGPTIAGFPLKLEASFAEPVIASPRGWRWQGPAFFGSAALWDPFTIAVDLSGDHRIERSKPKDRIDATLDQARGVVYLASDGQIDHATVETGSLVLKSQKTRISADRSTWRLGPLLPKSGDRPQELIFAGEIEALVLPKKKAGPLGPSVAHLAVDGILLGPIPDGNQQQVLKRWRDAGGVLELGRVELDWGPLGLDGKGTLGLDQKFRPLGTFTARMRGLMQTLDLLISAGLLKPGQAVPAKIALLALGGKKDENGERVIVLPITLQDGQLYLGPAPVVRISPVL